MTTFTIFGDIKRNSRVQRLEEEGITTVFGDVKLDFTKAPLAPGDHSMRVLTVFGDVVLRFADDVGVEIDGLTVFSDVEVEHLASGEDEQPGGSWTSDNFASASVRVHVNLVAVFGDIEIVRVPVPTAAYAEARQLSDEREMNVDQSYEGETVRLPARE